MNNSIVKISYRNNVKDKLSSTILILGLVAGLTSVTLIAVYLNFKFSYDNYHEDADRIYRIVSAEKNKSEFHELTPAKYSDALRGLPGVHSATKLFKANQIDIKEGDREFIIENAFFADSGFFKVFTHKFIAGNTNKLLSNPFEAVITRTYAEKIWGNSDPIGKVFTFERKDYSVKAVIEDVPYNSHFRFNVLLSFSSWQSLFDQVANEFYTYFRIDNKLDKNTILNNANTACQKEYSEFLAKGFGKVDYIFQPLLDIHLNSESFQFRIAEHGDKNLIIILSLIGLCTLIILVLNYINLLTVKFQKRLKEIGIRKVMGANKQNLIFQFLGESVIISMIASLLSILTVAILIKPFSLLFDINLADYITHYYKIIAFLIASGIVVGILASLIPAYMIVKEGNPESVFFTSRSLKRKKIMYAAALIQFAVVSGLLTALLVTANQIDYLRKKDLGFNKDHIVYFDNESRINYTAMIPELEKIEGVKKATASETIPGTTHSGMTLCKYGAPQSERFNALEERVQMNYLPTYGLNLIAGRDFAGTNEDEKDNIILNETAVKKLGYSVNSIINQKVQHFNGPKTVIGVVSDYHYMSLHSKIEPLILSNSNPRADVYSLLINTDDYKSLIERVGNKIKSIDPRFNVQIKFLNEHMNDLYKADEKDGTIIQIAAVLCSVLSLSGLFALTSYSVLRRTKEIGIRKVLGASVANILLILYKDFIMLIIIANIVIVPVTWPLVTSWLNNYPYHINIGMGFYIKALLITLLIAVITIFYHTSKAALKNPIDTIKYE